MYRTIENPCGLQKTYGKQNARKMIRINSAGTQLCCLPMSQSTSFQKAKACLSLFCCHSHDSYAEEILEPFLATVSVILQNQNSARDWLWPFTTFNCSTVFAPAVAHGVRRTHASRLAGSISELQRIWQRKHVIRDGHSECRAMYTCTQLTHNFAESHVFNDRTRLFFFSRKNLHGKLMTQDRCFMNGWHGKRKKGGYRYFWRRQVRRVSVDQSNSGTMWNACILVCCRLTSLTLRFAFHDKIYTSWRDSKENVSGCKLRLPPWYRCVDTLKVMRQSRFKER